MFVSEESGGGVCAVDAGKATIWCNLHVPHVCLGASDSCTDECSQCVAFTDASALQGTRNILHWQVPH